MSTLSLRQRFVDIAKRDVGQTESSRNRGPAIEKFWPVTSYPDGYANREPYCAAAMCYWLREWLKDPEVLAALKMTAAQSQVWRCKSAGAWAWAEWAKKQGLQILSDSPGNVLHTGDIVVYDFSHIGLVTGDKADRIYTIEANTGPPTGSQRDGDGIYTKDRPREIARQFIRILA